MDVLKNMIRDIPDFPKPGILFKDITPLLANPQGMRLAIQTMAEPFRKMAINHVVGIESRGFMFGPALALELGAGFVPVRKPGKLPFRTNSVSYELEYGVDQLEIHQDAVRHPDRVLIVDDVIATGGTAKATGQLVRELGAELVGFAFLIELSFLKGREKLGNDLVHASLIY
ncbi:MAG: adenine phosphoribosyltransferase [Acidobacteria bacterium]|nr:adenine phosphoribosyltransferase [Acidobacteriota bacterium]MCB9398161.1 adenine phosphoribosyltransferase [Acidobacteriota bacterium]